MITTNPVNNVAIEAHKAHTTYNLHNLITANPVNNVTIEAHNDDDINNIICYYTNVQSLPNKYDDILSTVVEEKKAKIIGISETWCRPDIEDYEIALPGYTIFRKDRTVRIGGGVLLYVSEELSCQPVNMLNNHNFEDSIWCKVIINPRQVLLLGVCYRSTCSNHVNNAELLDLLTKASNLPDVSHVLIMGDFNYAGIDWEHMIIEGGRDAQLFHENALDNLLVQHVNFN